MTIEEKGTRFSEEIDIDEKQDVEVFRVPAHNNVEGLMSTMILRWLVFFSF